MRAKTIIDQQIYSRQMAGIGLLHQRLQEASEEVLRVEAESKELDDKLRVAEADALERSQEIQKLLKVHWTIRSSVYPNVHVGIAGEGAESRIFQKRR